jgi:capsular exopolysaccharide synthesis family protein
MARKSQSIIDFFDIESPYVTEFRRLLYRVLAKREESNLKTIMLTSSMLSEGKSTICSFLGLTSAVKKEMKTIIVDTDLRRPSINQFFKINSQVGMNEILHHSVSFSDAIVSSGVGNLDLITSGSHCANPSEVFNVDIIENMINELKFTYDLIILDSAPLLPVSDPMLLAPIVDGVLLVVKAGVTQKDVVRRAINILDANENNLMGVILNNMSHSLPKHFEYGYYKYEYRQQSVYNKKNLKSSPSVSQKLHGADTKKTLSDEKITRNK